MATWKANIDEARRLIKQARSQDKCLDQASATEDAVDDMLDDAEFSLTEWIAVIAILGTTVAAVLASGGLALSLLAIGGGALAEFGVAATYLERVKKANKRLEKKLRKLRDCLK